MYLDLFKLTDLPFRLSPDPQFLFLSKNHARAKAYMESTIWFTDGFVIITGEIGAGKTTLIETFLRELEKDVIVAQVNQTQVSVTEFLQSVLVQFGFQPFRMKKAELIATLNQYLIEQYAAGKKVMLIVDEAQNLSNRVLEEVRMLSGIETTREKVLRIILAGQPELNEKLDSPELIQLVQRVRLRFHLTAHLPVGRHVGAAESVDRLLRIADDDDRARVGELGRREPAVEDPPLEPVGVLELVDEHHGEPTAKGGGGACGVRGVVGEAGGEVGDERVEGRHGGAASAIRDVVDDVFDEFAPGGGEGLGRMGGGIGGHGRDRECAALVPNVAADHLEQCGLDAFRIVLAREANVGAVERFGCGSQRAQQVVAHHLSGERVVGLVEGFAADPSHLHPE